MEKGSKSIFFVFYLLFYFIITYGSLNLETIQSKLSVTKTV